MEASSPKSDPASNSWFTKFLPASILINTFATFFTLFITTGAYSPSRYYYWDLFETFIALAWLFFLIALTLSILAQMIISYQHDDMLAFGSGRNGYKNWRDGGMGSKTRMQRLAVAFLVKMPLDLLITLATLIGFMFCTLCVASHSEIIGWVGFGWTMLMMVLAVITWIFTAGHA